MSDPIDPKNIQQYSHLSFIAKQAVEGFITGLHKSPFHGFSVEFAEHKIYNPGESTRNIDWKLFARTEKLFTKSYEEETNLRCQIIIDNSSSMYFPYSQRNNENNYRKIDFSCYAAAAIMLMLKKQRDAVGLSVFSDNLETHVDPRSTSLHLKLLYSLLDKVITPKETPINKKTNAAKILHELADRIHKRSLVIIFSDMFDNVNSQDEIFSALQHFKHNKHEIILFHVLDYKHELNFEFDNRPFLFVDLENGTEVKLNPNEVKKDYVKQITTFHQNLKLKCGQYKIDFIEADINQGYNQILMPYIIKRNRMP